MYHCYKAQQPKGFGLGCSVASLKIWKRWDSPLVTPGFANDLYLMSIPI